MPSSCSVPNGNTFTLFDFDTSVWLQNVTMHYDALSGQYYSNTTVTMPKLSATVPAPPDAVHFPPSPASPHTNIYGSPYAHMLMPGTVYGPGYGAIHTAQSAGLTPGRLGSGEGSEFRPRLRPGPGRVPTNGGCFVEVTSHLYDGESWTDKAVHIDTSARVLGITLNDFLPDDERQGLLALAPRLNRVRACAPLEEKAAAWLRTAARTLQIWAKRRRVGAVAIDELAHTLRAFTAHPTMALRAPLQTTAAACFDKRVREWLVQLDVAMGHYMRADFAQAQSAAHTVLTSIVGPGMIDGLLQMGTGGAVSVFEALLQEWEDVFELPAIGLGDVPAESWARMHRAVFGLAA